MNIESAVTYNKNRYYNKPLWREIQRLIGTSDDGVPGPMTARAVADYQDKNGLTADGKVGPATLEHMGLTPTSAPADPEVGSCHFIGTSRVPAQDDHGHGYDYLTLRKDVGELWVKMWDIVQEAGGYLTTAGGLRRLSAGVSQNRSSTSLHYLGRAFDLATYSAMDDLEEDPFICTHDPDHERNWIIYVKASEGKEMELDAYTYKLWEARKDPQKVTGKFINFTELALEHGFHRIGMRSYYLNRRQVSDRGGAEWWHFQYEGDLEEGKSTFGEELLKVWTSSQLEGTGPWSLRNKKWNSRGYFS
jgi:hypothetical protein